MRLPLVLVGILLVLAGGGLTGAVVLTHDDVPDLVAGCVTDRGAQVIRGSATLGALRADLATDGVRQGASFAVGDARALVLVGTGYRMLVVAGRKSPALVGDVGSRAYNSPDSFSVVAVERGDLRVVEGCARAAG